MWKPERGEGGARGWGERLEWGEGERSGPGERTGGVDGLNELAEQGPVLGRDVEAGTEIRD